MINSDLILAPILTLTTLLAPIVQLQNLRVGSALAI